MQQVQLPNSEMTGKSTQAKQQTKLASGENAQKITPFFRPSFITMKPTENRSFVLGYN